MCVVLFCMCVIFVFQVICLACNLHKLRVKNDKKGKKMQEILEKNGKFNV
jgi:signal transduction histidine kinase